MGPAHCQPILFKGIANKSSLEGVPISNQNALHVPSGPLGSPSVGDVPAIQPHITSLTPHLWFMMIEDLFAIFQEWNVWPEATKC